MNIEHVLLLTIGGIGLFSLFCWIVGKILNFLGVHEPLRFIGLLGAILYCFNVNPALAPTIVPRPPELILEPSLEDSYCLAKVIYFEARSQSFDEKIGVAMVALNRLKLKKYTTLCGVVFDGCQFSWVCNLNLPREALSRKGIYEQKEWLDALAMAKMLLINYEKGVIIDPTNGADYFHEKGIHPNWGKVKIMSQIGDTVFKKKVGK